MARTGDSLISLIFTTTPSEEVNCGSLSFQVAEPDLRCIVCAIFCAPGPGQVPSDVVFCVTPEPVETQQ